MLWIVGLLSGYWLLMAFVPVPGYGAGRLDVEGNFAHYVDRMVLGAHNYAATKTWDPEGIVSTLPAIATTLFGILCGHLLRLGKSLQQRAAWMAIAGVGLLAAGLLCSLWLPINKKLWTSSFSLFMAGLDFVFFAGFLWLIDGRGKKRMMKPFVILGMNSITIYMISELFDEFLGQTGLHRMIYQKVFAPVASPVNASLLWALAYTGLMFVIAWTMYKRRWVVRI
jgi:predicted acyltransferase